MDCRLIRGELVAFHFGSVDAEARERIEAHLVECGECVRSFLALKREIETSDTALRPSTEARLRLRRAVAEQVASRGVQPRPGWWRRPLALGFTALTAAALMLSVVAVRAQFHHMAEVAGTPSP